MPALSLTEAQISGLTALVGFAALFAHFLVGAALIIAARRLAERLGGVWRLAIWAPVTALPLPVCGIGLTFVLLLRAFAEIAAVDAATRATALARGISDAMSCTALGVVVAWSLYAMTAVAIVIARLTRAPG